jgi:hypothetical protein
MDSLDTQLNCHILEKKHEMIACLASFLNVILHARQNEEPANHFINNNNNSNDSAIPFLRKSWEKDSDIWIPIESISGFRLSEVVGVDFQGSEFAQGSVSNGSNIFHVCLFTDLFFLF